MRKLRHLRNLSRLTQLISPKVGIWTTQASLQKYPAVLPFPKEHAWDWCRQASGKALAYKVKGLGFESQHRKIKGHCAHKCSHSCHVSSQMFCIKRETTYDRHKLKSPGLFSSMFRKYFRTSLSHYLYHPTLLVQATVNLAFRVKWFPKQFAQIHSGNPSHGSHNGLKRHGYIIYLVKIPLKYS